MNSSDMPAPAESKTHPIDWALQTDKVDLVLQDVDLKLRRRRRSRARKGGAALIAAAILSLAFWAVPTLRETGTTVTPIGHRQTLALQDGSTAELNARTNVHTDFRYGRRTVQLDRGEAFFSVAKDKAHPFLVETPGGVVRVTGTHFNVRITASGQPEVTLLEGSVGLQGQAIAPTSLIPGQQFDPTTKEVRNLAPAALSQVTAWREGRLALDGLTLAQAVEKFSAFNGTSITVATDVASLHMGGSCSLDDLPAFLDFLPRALSVQVVPGGDGSYQIVAR